MESVKLIGMFDTRIRSKRQPKVLMSFDELKKLDEFTTMFKSEDTLKLYLFGKGMLSKEEMSMTLNGRIPNKRVQLIYENLKKYLDITFLKNRVFKLFSQPGFIEKLLEIYEDVTIRDMKEIYNYLGDKGNYVGAARAMDKFVEKICLNKNSKSVNYENLRNLALFIYDCEQRFKNTIAPTSISNDSNYGEQTSFFGKL